jgi:hypothetical protein
MTRRIYRNRRRRTMRVIALPTNEKEARGVFGIFHTATFAGTGPKEHAEARVLGKLQDALEAVSHDGEPVTNEKGETMTPRVLNDGVAEIRLEDAHYEVLKKRIWGAGIDWLTGATRRVMAAYDLVSEAAEEKPGSTPGEAKDADVVPMKRRKK